MIRLYNFCKLWDVGVALIFLHVRVHPFLMTLLRMSFIGLRKLLLSSAMRPGMIMQAYADRGSTV